MDKDEKRQINLGLIGAGLSARITMLPTMRNTGLYRFRGLASTGGIATAQANKAFPFEYSTDDYKVLLEDKDIDLIAVATRHDSHAKFVAEALMAGKNVYCETPLCLTLAGLDRIEAAYRDSDGELFVGLNRRHSPLIHRIRTELRTDQVPAVYNYIANAGSIAEDYWMQKKAGRGRIIGGIVHLIDAILYLDGSGLVGLDASLADNDGHGYMGSAALALRFRSGAIGTVTYTSMGSRKYPKEQLRVFTNGSVYELNNYIELDKYGSDRKRELRLKQDKGTRNEYRYIASVLKGQTVNEGVGDALEASRLLLGALEKYNG